MPHDMPLVTTLAAAFAAAWVLGVVAQRLKLSPIVGYLLAGVVIGPHTPGFTGDVQLASQLAEIGVVLLMFGVGLHFHVSDLREVGGIAIPGALVQSSVATLLGLGIGLAFGWPVASGLVLGMALSVASTVVLMRGLEAQNLVSTPAGHAAIGWLIVEDILTVVVLVVIPVLGHARGAAGAGTAGGLFGELALALAKLLALVALVFVVGSRLLPRALVYVARLRSRELFTLTILALAIAIASGASLLFGASMALGAFLAGMVVGQSPVSQQAAADALPLRDAFAVLFFVSVGGLSGDLRRRQPPEHPGAGGPRARQPPGRDLAALRQPHPDDRRRTPAQPGMSHLRAGPLLARAKRPAAGGHERRLLRGGRGGGGAHVARPRGSGRGCGPGRAARRASAPGGDAAPTRGGLKERGLRG